MPSQKLFSTEELPETTRGALKAARLYAATPDGESKNTVEVCCSFNPYEYTVSQTNSYEYKPKAKADTKVEFKSVGPQTLKLSLIFDAYENGEGRDVSKTTVQLWELMSPEGITKIEKPDAPFVIFEWGVFKFLAVITNMTQKFILFDHDGVPLRAKVDITFTQHKSETKDYQTIERTSSGLTSVKSGDRLDSIAAENLGDPSKWRAIANDNNIDNPLALRPGQQLLIPGGRDG